MATFLATYLNIWPISFPKILLHLPRHNSAILKKETACSSEISVSAYNHTYYQNPQDYHLTTLNYLCGVKCIMLGLTEIEFHTVWLHWLWHWSELTKMTNKELYDIRIELLYGDVSEVLWLCSIKCFWKLYHLDLYYKVTFLYVFQFQVVWFTPHGALP